MSEPEVLNLVNEAFDRYEKETGKPRHEENKGKFDDLFTVLNKVKGGLWTCGILLGLPSIAFTIIQIIRFAKGH